MKDVVTFLHIKNKTYEKYRFCSFINLYIRKKNYSMFSTPIINLHVSYHTRFLISTY
ncbi:hypothetical protein BLGI_901 [Brevibacillus laterosporus GI-9]|nr:hypothetical protein BLGI_901 [Brevibacillus laterosporus GI-9]